MKIGKKPQDQSSLNSLETKNVPSPFYNSFSLAYRRADSFGAKHKLLRDFWAARFDGASMPEEKLELLHLRLSYEFMELDHILAKVPLPQKCKQNLEAARKYDVEGLHKDMKALVEIALNQEEGGTENMAKDKKAKKESSRPQVVHHYLEIFENQAKAQLTDDQIADAIEKKVGQKPTTKNVASYRCYYNQGKLEGQKTAPKDKLKAVRVVKAKAEKAEPKAKAKVKIGKKK